MEKLKIIEQGPLTDAEEWAMRQGMAIAERHLLEGDFQSRAALASEIAEALTAVRRDCHQGLM